MHVLLLVQTLIDEGCDDPHFWELFGKVVCTFGTGNKVEEQDVVLGHAFLSKDLDGHESGSTCNKSACCDQSARRETYQ